MPVYARRNTRFRRHCSLFSLSVGVATVFFTPSGKNTVATMHPAALPCALSCNTAYNAPQTPRCGFQT
ncbi:hypothetical protein, partial [Neisseria meningitidis]|uniref:hypothetical protein n=1 Tax=Neisseria meningitidis TaxID=487 RepID=UPI001BA8E32F